MCSPHTKGAYNNNCVQGALEPTRCFADGVRRYVRMTRLQSTGRGVNAAELCMMIRRQPSMPWCTGVLGCDSRSTYQFASERYFGSKARKRGHSLRKIICENICEVIARARSIASQPQNPTLGWCMHVRELQPNGTLNYGHYGHSASAVAMRTYAASTCMRITRRDAGRDAGYRRAAGMNINT